MTAPRPFDLDALLAAMDRAGVGDRAARRLRLNGTNFARLRTTGLTERQADVLAVRVGMHPGQVWPQWWTVDSLV